MTRFDDQSVLVVGGSSGIGAETAAQFVSLGARVTIASRSAEKLARAADTIGGGVATARLDVTDDDDVIAFFEKQEPWDHVVVTAAQAPGGPSRTLPLADAYQAMHSKFWGSYRVARVVDIRPGGSLTLVSGFLSQRPRATSVLQGAINGALDALVRGLALELAPVRVNSVSPGIIATPLWDRMPEKDRLAYFDNLAKSLPAGRVGYAEDIANAILYLAGTKFATGSTVLVDGGNVLA